MTRLLSSSLFIISLICLVNFISYSDSFIVHNHGTGTHTRTPTTSTTNKIVLQNNNDKSRPNVEIPNDFIQPEPKPLQISESTDIIEFTKATLAFILRLGTGAFVLGWTIDTWFYKDVVDEKQPLRYSLRLGPFSIRDISSVLVLNNNQNQNDGTPRPDKSLILYEYESSPFCKRVREMINLLDLTVEYRPCPGARTGFSDELYEKTGRRTVPYLYDPNTKKGLFESNDQIEYLLKNYGPQDKDSYDQKALWPITFEGFSIVTSTLAAILLGMPGSSKQNDARPDNTRMLPIEVWGNEASPFVKPVREKLCKLCLSHSMVSCSRGSSNRDKMMKKTGRFQVPYIVDPNTGIEMYESAEIVKYLDNVYTI